MDSHPATNAVALPARKQAIRDLADQLAPERHRWVARNAYFHAEDRRFLRLLIPAGARVLDLGCGDGDLLSALAPAHGLGVDFSPRMVEVDTSRHPHLEFRIGDVEDRRCVDSLGGPFDYILLSDTIGSLEDCESMLAMLHAVCTADTRVVIAYYSNWWEPLLRLAERLGWKMPQHPQNFLPTPDIVRLLALADFEAVRCEWRQLVPLRLLGLGSVINRYIGTLPGIRRLCLRSYIVARSLRRAGADPPASATVVVPCRNERDTVEAVVQRIPRFCSEIEILFVEGHSTDGTLDEIRRVMAAYPERNIRVIEQRGVGKADAVFQGFDEARGDVLMILDGDLTMPPEQLPKFWNALAAGKGEFINGTRLVYPMEEAAMPFLNLVANRLFSLLLTWLLNQRLTDTLCGTKAMMRRHYERLKALQPDYGRLDPFGDFALLFGASRLNLRTLEIPIRYRSRVYGRTQISRFRHGWLLLRALILAYRQLKAF